MIRALWLGLVVLASIGASPAAAKPHLFADEAPLNIVITAPFPNLARTDSTSTNPYPATLTVTDQAGAPESLPIQLRARGHQPARRVYCSFPPILLRFDKPPRTEACSTASEAQARHLLQTAARLRTADRPRVPRVQTLQPDHADEPSGAGGGSHLPRQPDQCAGSPGSASDRGRPTHWRHATTARS